MKPANVYLSASTLQQPLPVSTSIRRRELLEGLAERVMALSPDRVRVAIDGLTAAGKTSFGHELAEEIVRRGRPVLRASLDDFKRPWRDRHLYDRESGEGYYRNAFDCAAAIDLLLEPAGSDGSGRVVLCGIDPLTQIDHSATVTPAAEDAVLIVDGLFAFRPELNRFWDLRIWLEVTPEVSVRRGGARDQDETVHRDRYLPAERLYMS